MTWTGCLEHVCCVAEVLYRLLRGRTSTQESLQELMVRKNEFDGIDLHV